MKAMLSSFGRFALSFLLLVSFYACSQEENGSQKEQQDPVITFNFDEVLVSQDGAECAVEYTIGYPVEGATLEVVLGADWLVGLDLSIPGIIMFQVLPNEQESPRETVISLHYSALDAPVSLPVKQEAADPAAIVFENLEVGVNVYTLDVLPHDKNARYILFSSNYSYMVNNDLLEDDDALFADDIAYFQQLADENHMSLTKVLEQVSRVGDQIGFQVSGLGPGMEYMTYAYVIDIEKQERLSDIYRIAVTTRQPDQVDVDFTFDFDIKGSIVDWTIDPGDYEGLYFWNAIILSDFYLEYGPDASVEDFAVTNWNNIIAIYLQYGSTVEQILEDFCLSGPTTKTLKSLLGNTEYAFYALAADSEVAYAASAATVAYQTTGAVATSDLELSFEILDLKDRSATILCHPSNHTDTYAATYVEKSKWETYGETEEERFEYIFTWYYMGELIGEQTIHAEGLYPETDYVVFGFGYQGGTNTTPMFVEEFRTMPAAYSGATLRIEWDQYYDIPECYALDTDKFSMYYDYEGYAFMPMYIEWEPAGSTAYYAIYILQEGDEYSDDDLISELIYEPHTETFMIYVLPYDYTLLFAGFAEDEQGEFGPLYREEFVLRKENTGDAQELLDLINEKYGAPKRNFSAPGSVKTIQLR